jgi:hypothetical protein
MINFNDSHITRLRGLLNDDEGEAFHGYMDEINDLFKKLTDEEPVMIQTMTKMLSVAVLRNAMDGSGTELMFRFGILAGVLMERSAAANKGLESLLEVKE